MYEPLKDLYDYSNVDTVFMYENNLQNFQVIYVYSAQTNSSYSIFVHPNPMFSSAPYLSVTIKVTIDSVGIITRNNQIKSIQFNM